MPDTLEKSPADSRVYRFNFANYAEVLAGETVASAVVPAVSGLTISAPVVTEGKYVDVRISGGSVGTTYTVSCTATMSGGSQWTRQRRLYITNL